ncbi:MAG: aldo/keto reductase, partial [Acidobacteriota bacterium]
WNGRSEEVYGAVLPPFRKHIFLTTKANQRTRAGAEAELHTSLKRLRTDYVDLWQIHAVGERQEVEEIFGPGGAIEAFEAARKAGKCRFIGFTGHRDPRVHLAMLDAYDKFDSILMPLNIADADYLSFQKLTLPVAAERGMGIQGMKNFANAKLLQRFSAGDCLQYVLSLPVSCTAIGCTTIGQLEDDVRIAQQFKPMSPDEMQALRKRAEHIAGPALEDWKRDVRTRASGPAPAGERHG